MSDLEPCRDWLRQVWSHRSFAEAISLASPLLAAQVRRVLDRQRNDPRRIRRVVVSVARYMLRMTGRSTPFGLFAGVAVVRFGARTAARWGNRHRAVVRADAAWVASLVTSMEACPDLLRRLPVVVNNMCTVRGGRLVLPLQEPADGEAVAAGQVALSDVSVRYTRAAAAVLEYAQVPIVLSDLAGKLAAEFPRTSPQVIEAMLAELVKRRLLLTGLRPPMTVTDGLGHVVAQLRSVQAAAVPEIAEPVRAVSAIADEMGRHNRTSAPGEQARQRVGLAERMRLTDRGAEQPIMVDLCMDLDITLPAALVQEAEAAAAALTRLTEYPFGLAPWREFHVAFLERYGVEAVVPLLELVNPDTGLGFPATYRGSDRTAAVDALSERDRHLLTLVQKATTGGGDEIVLDEQTIADLTRHLQGPQQVPPHVELFVQVHAASDRALQRGEFTLLVTGAARAAGATTGRFLDLLDEPDRARFRAVYADVSTLRIGALPAQVSCPPVRAASGNVARAPATLARVMSVGEHQQRGVDVLPLSELAVGGDADGLYLVSLADRRLIEPTVLNAVEFRHFSQPLARFLCEVSRARAAVYMPFSWGAAATMPFLPRVRYGRTVLALARWNVQAADLPGRTASWPLWQAALTTWRRRFRMPRQVYLVEADNLLPLDLDQILPGMLLRSHLDRHGQARLDEAPPAEAYGWLGGHAHEVVIPLASTCEPLPPPAHLAAAEPMGRGDAHLPGNSSRLYAKLYTHPDRHTDILATLASLLAGWEPPAPWWYLPYQTPEPHLRVRVSLPDADHYGTGAQRLGAWAAGLRREGLLGRMQLDTYQPETGRYGTGTAMTAAERVFVADSAAALAQRQTATAGSAHQAVAVASLVDLTIGFLGDTRMGMRWLVDQLPREPAPVDRTLHAAATGLADPRGDWAALRATENGEEVLATWRRRRAALSHYRQLLARQRDPLSVLPSLLHIHHVRMVGIDPDRERIGRRLARAAAQRWIATSPGATP